MRTCILSTCRIARTSRGKSFSQCSLARGLLRFDPPEMRSKRKRGFPACGPTPGDLSARFYGESSNRWRSRRSTKTSAWRSQKRAGSQTSRRNATGRSYHVKDVRGNAAGNWTASYRRRASTGTCCNRTSGQIRRTRRGGRWNRLPGAHLECYRLSSFREEKRGRNVRFEQSLGQCN